jgi:hypothetical protein
MYQLWIVAGPNGSGKTTLTQRHLARRLPVVNPDDIALEIKGQRTDSPDTNVSAGREALLRQRRFLAERRSFAVETTFSGNREIALMREAKTAGYKVNLTYLSTDSPMISVGRIKTRVRAGGHLVPTSRCGPALSAQPRPFAGGDRLSRSGVVARQFPPATAFDRFAGTGLRQKHVECAAGLGPIGPHCGFGSGARIIPMIRPM